MPNKRKMNPPTVVSKQMGDKPATHYLLGPQRESRAEAEKDLIIFLKSSEDDPQSSLR